MASKASPVKKKLDTRVLRGGEVKTQAKEGLEKRDSVFKMFKKDSETSGLAVSKQTSSTTDRKYRSSTANKTVRPANQTASNRNSKSGMK